MPALPYWLFPGDDRPTDQIDDEIAEELQLHLDLLAEEQERRGVAPEEAKQKAAERFGDFNQLLRRCRREKQGDVPMLKRVQAVLTGLLLVSVIYMGWQQWTMATVIAQEQKDIKSGLVNVINQLNRIAPLPVVNNAVPGSPAATPNHSPSSVFKDQIIAPDGIPLAELDRPTLAEQADVERMVIEPAVWTPPANPDPQEILREAKADAKSKKYDIALAKHVWFYENAESIRPSLGAVRLSFALSYWYDLGLDYPPALEVLRLIRDKIEVRILNGEDVGKGFHDYAAINEELDEDARTVKAFANLDHLSPKAARSAFHFAKDALIEGKEYELYAKNVDDMRGYELITRAYESKQRVTDRPQKEGNAGLDSKYLTAIADTSFRNEAGTLVAVLAITDRKDEAAKVAELFKQKLDDEQFHKDIEAALEGKIPAKVSYPLPKR